MLRELRIRDFAIIDDLTVSFRPGLNVITGETGAGKSIILQALALLCGGRAVPDLIRSDAEAASIEGVFEGAGAAASLEGLGLTADDELVVRRFIPRTSKGRVYINGSPATVALLAQLGNALIHIYGQQEQALLLRPESHLDFLDGFGSLTLLRERMATAYAAFAAAQSHWRDLTERREAFEQRRELLAFQVEELSKAAVQADEEAVLRRDRDVLRHAERLQQVTRAGEAALYSGEGAMAAGLARLGSQLAELARIDSALSAPAELVEAARVQLEEAALQLRTYAERIHFDPERLEQIEERLGLLARLSRKYGIPSTELPARHAALREDLASLAAHGADCERARAEADARRTCALQVARELSAARTVAARRLEKEMARELAILGLPNAVFQVMQQAATDTAAVDRLSASGLDTVEFHLSANPGEPPKPLARVASGGELSRIMLALKTLTASAAETPILIFDEVDSGIGGAVADAVARRLKTLAATRQLLCITHLPQIAAYADHHYAVEKRSHRGRTIARARVLAPEERVRELSRMLGGPVPAAEAERYARHLVEQARSVSGQSL